MKPSYHGFKQAHPGKIVCDPETKINSEAELWFHVHLWMWHCLNFANNSHQRSARYSEWTKAAFCLDSHSVRDSTEVLGFKWLLHHTHNIREEKNRNVINTSDFYSLQLLELFRKIITRITAASFPSALWTGRTIPGLLLSSSMPVHPIHSWERSLSTLVPSVCVSVLSLTEVISLTAFLTCHTALKSFWCLPSVSFPCAPRSPP